MAWGSRAEMAIKKQEFYEGAALHILMRVSGCLNIQYQVPFFVLNNQVAVLLKYSTKNRSPWGFTFSSDERGSLEAKACASDTVIGLVCGSDGVAVVTYEAYKSIIGAKSGAVHVACYRRYGEHYEVRGPACTLKKKISPSSWLRILDRGLIHESNESCRSSVGAVADTDRQ